MPRKKSDSTVLAEIREIIKDWNNDFQIRCYKGDGEYMKKGDLDRLDADLAVAIIKDVLDGTQDELTRDYRMTKRMAARSAKAALSP